MFLKLEMLHRLKKYKLTEAVLNLSCDDLG